jgi:hypothetical protein
LAPPPLDNVDWNNMEIKFTKVTFGAEPEVYGYVRQNYSSTGVKINVEHIINQTSILNLVAGAFFTRELKNFTVSSSVETCFSPINVTNIPNNSYVLQPNCSSVSETHITQRWVDEEAKDFLFVKNLTNNRAKSVASLLTIPKITDLDEFGNNGTKQFKLKVKPIITLTKGSGWGYSFAYTLAVTDTDETREFHPLVNTSYAFQTNESINTTGGELRNLPLLSNSSAGINTGLLNTSGKYRQWNPSHFQYYALKESQRRLIVYRYIGSCQS